MAERGLSQAAKQALSALKKHAALPWGKPGYPTPNPGAELLYEAIAYLEGAVARDKLPPDTDPKMTAHFLQKSAARLERLLAINAQLVIVQREIEVAGNRLRELERSFGVQESP